MLRRCCSLSGTWAAVVLGVIGGFLAPQVLMLRGA